MITFEKVHEKIRETNQKLSLLRDQKEKLQAALDMYLRLIVENCEPACVDAVEEFNVAATSLSIPIKSIRLSFNADEGLINMGVSLKYQDGTEPDEELDDHWFGEITSRVRVYVEARFSKAGIPFRFGKLTVPVGYFGR